MGNCNVCGLEEKQPIYNSNRSLSITSLCEFYEGKTEVYFCDRCGHLQTIEIQDIQEYYDKQYKILIDSEEEDQLYKIIDNQKKFRVDHQVQTLLNKLNLPENAKILDYGCAKSSTLKKLATIRPDIAIHLFDVSEMYIPFWEKFTAPDNWAVYSPKQEWMEYFDVVLSFFALEHVSSPKDFLNNIRNLLKPEGYFYFIVPNVYANIADLIVVDHVNHFSENSIEYLLHSSGFRILDIDASVHDSAFVVTGMKTEYPVEPLEEKSDRVMALKKQVDEMSSFWKKMSQRVQQFESEHSAESSSAIYGSGFYGTLITSCLNNPAKIKCFIDSNPYRQGKLLFGKPIVAPEELDALIDIVYVGLNPNNARSIIEKMSVLHTRHRDYFYL